MPQHPDSALAQKQWEQAALLSKRYELSHDSIEKARLEQELETEKNKCKLIGKGGCRHSRLTHISKHHCICHIYQCSDQILDHNRKG